MLPYVSAQAAPPARDPYFESARGAWVLSRYRDVMAALREPNLWPPGARGEDQSLTRDELGRLRLRGDVQEALSASRVAVWECEARRLAHAAAAQIEPGSPVDLLDGFARPICLDLALLVMGAAPADRERLAGLGDRVFEATGAPDDSPLRPQAAEATAELDRFFQHGPMPMGEPTFVAISQTLPRLLANGWLALYGCPSEVARLRAQPDLMPNAVEELLRHSGIVRRIWRVAKDEVDLGAVRIARDERAMLLLASANRDPEQFPEPERLDLTRRFASHVALGMGRNSCVGAIVVRMVYAATTAALVENFPIAELPHEPKWCAGSGYCFPKHLTARLFRAE
jgi:cytochrome P450